MSLALELIVDAYVSLNDRRALAELKAHREDLLAQLQARKGWFDLRMHELWRARELIYFFVWRDIKVRYKQTALGVAWAVIQPLFTMAVYLFCFTWIFPARVQAPLGFATDANLYLLAGIIPWITLSQVMARSPIVKRMA